MLETSNIPLEEAPKRARVWEAAGEQARQMTLPSKDSEASVNSVRSTSGQGRKGKTCFNCGKEGHFARDNSCPARGKMCAKCGRYGHFAACCKGDKDDHESRKPSPRQWKGSNREQRGSGKQANYVDDEQSRSTSEVFSHGTGMFCVNFHGTTCQCEHQWHHKGSPC